MAITVLGPLLRSATRCGRSGMMVLRLCSTQSIRGCGNEHLVEIIEKERVERYLSGRNRSSDQKPKASQISRFLPLLNESYRLDLAGSLARLLEDNGVKALLWGDILHAIHGGETSLPHVSPSPVENTSCRSSILMQEYSYIVTSEDLLNAHDILQNAGFERCILKDCYLGYKHLDAPAAHYHISRPSVSWPAYSRWKYCDIVNDPNPDLEELETIRLYRLENTLWEIKSLELTNTYDGEQYHNV